MLSTLLVSLALLAPVDAAAVEAARSTVQPLVEAAAGRSLTSSPEIRLTDTDEIGQALIERALLVSLAIDPDLDRDEVRLLLTVDSIAAVERMIGCVVGGPDDVVLLNGPALDALLDGDAFDASEANAVLELVLAHELAHVLHQQYVDRFAQAGGVRNVEQGRALRAVAEGFAELVVERIASERGQQALLERLHAALHAGAAPGSVAAEEHAAIYGAGLAFMQARMADGGMDAVWSALDAPPPIYAQVRDPETYGQPVMWRTDARRLYRGTPARLGVNDWMVQTRLIDGEQASAPFASIGAAEQAAIVAMVDSAAAIMLNGDTRGKAMSLTAYDLAEGVDARLLLEQLRGLSSLQVDRVRMVAAERSMAVESISPDIDAGLGTRAFIMRTSMATGLPEPLDRMFVIFAAAVRDRHAVQFTATIDEVTNEQVGEELDRLLTRMADGSVRAPVEPAGPPNPQDVALSAARSTMAGDWAIERQEMPASGLAQLMGGTVQAQAMAELAYVRGRGMLLEQRNAKRGELIALSLIETTDEASGESIAGALVQGINQQFEALAAQLSVERGDAIEQDLGSGIMLGGQQAAIEMPGQPAGQMLFAVARRGNVIVHLMVTVQGDGVAEVPVDAIRAIYSSLEVTGDKASSGQETG